MATNWEGASIDFDTSFSWNSLPKLARRLTHTLRASRRALGENGDRCTLNMAADCLREIHRVGESTLATLCAEHLEKLRRHLFTQRLTPGLIDATTPWPLIEFITPAEDLLPFEVLPFADGRPFPSIRKVGDLDRAAMRFPGLGGITRRLVKKSSGSESNVLAGKPVRMKMFAHHELDGALEEAKFLANGYDLDGPWPFTNSKHDAASMLKLVMNCRRPASTGKEIVLDQIHHFSCHCDRDDNDEAYLRFCAAGGEEFQVSLTDFQSRYTRRHPKTNRPLVFLNACNSNSPDIFEPTTWGLAFHRLQSRAVIATEAPAPDAFALAFSKQFYAGLLNRQTVGHSLQTARWKLLRDWKNPMGLLYTLFGNPNLHIA